MSSWKRLAIRLDSYFNTYLASYTNRLFVAALMAPNIGASIAHLPTKKHTYTIIKGPHIDKESREVWELAIYRKILTIDGPNDAVRRFRAYIEQEERSIYSSVRVALSMKESTFIPIERRSEKRDYKLDDFLFAPFAPAHRVIPRSTENPDLLYLDPTKVVRQSLTEEEYSLTDEEKQEALRLGQPIDSEPKRPPIGLSQSQWAAYKPLLEKQPGESKQKWQRRKFLGPSSVEMDLTEGRKSEALLDKFDRQLDDMRDKYLREAEAIEKPVIPEGDVDPEDSLEVVGGMEGFSPDFEGETRSPDDHEP